MYAAAFYRILKIKQNPEYLTVISKRINTHMKSWSDSAVGLPLVLDKYESWAMDTGYTGLIAAIDMFFYRFPNHSSAKIRVCTTGSRYRDCTSLLSYSYISDLLGFPNFEQLVLWMFIPAIGDEIDRMMKSGEENVDQYSYFPYQIDLRLVRKSCYSATANPLFHQFAHAIGCLMKSDRSMKARFITDKLKTTIIAKAHALPYTGDF